MTILVKSVELYSTDILGNKELVFEAKGRYAFNKINAYVDTQ